MFVCASGHEDIVYQEGRGDPCPLCAANQSLTEALAEVSQLEGRVEELDEENDILEDMLAKTQTAKGVTP